MDSVAVAKAQPEFAQRVGWVVSVYASAFGRVVSRILKFRTDFELADRSRLAFPDSNFVAADIVAVCVDGEFKVTQINDGSKRAANDLKLRAGSNAASRNVV